MGRGEHSVVIGPDINGLEVVSRSVEVWRILDADSDGTRVRSLSTASVICHLSSVIRPWTPSVGPWTA